MLVLNRRVGETICIGDDVYVTVYDKLRYHVTMGVIASPSAQLFYGETRLRPAILPDGERFYLISLLTTESFRIDDVELKISFNPSYLGTGPTRKRQVRVAIAAPQSVTVDREEIHLQRLDRDGKRRPTLPFATWLRQANLAVSSRVAA
jgi:sRNA-binding carbon storage regulator CsrA